MIISFLEIPLTGQIAVPTENQLPERAQVVIAGAGLVGNSVACHVSYNEIFRFFFQMKQVLLFLIYKCYF